MQYNRRRSIDSAVDSCDDDSLTDFTSALEVVVDDIINICCAMLRNQTHLAEKKQSATTESLCESGRLLLAHPACQKMPCIRFLVIYCATNMLLLGDTGLVQESNLEFSGTNCIPAHRRMAHTPGCAA